MSISQSMAWPRKRSVGKAIGRIDSKTAGYGFALMLALTGLE
jgi:hypothetical protein